MKRISTVVLLLAACLAGRSVRASSDFYVKGDDWLGTLRASQHAIDHPETIPERPPHSAEVFRPRSSGVLRHRNAPELMRVDITGQTLLTLIADDGGDDISCDHAVWAHARLITAEGESIWLDTLEPESVRVGWGEFFAGERPIEIGGVRFDRHLFAHAESAVTYRLEAGIYTSFEAYVGIDDQTQGHASVRFTVSNQRQISHEARLESFWSRLIADFPEQENLVLIAMDWFRQENLSLTADQHAFRPRAEAAVALCAKTHDFLIQAGVDEPAFAAALEALRQETTAAQDWRRLFLEARLLRRRMIMAHPALDFDRILINRNPPTLYSHNGDQHLGRQSRIGPGLTVLEDWKSGSPRVTALLEDKLPPGATRNPDLHYDGDRVAFAFCDHTRPGHKRYFLYEAAIDGSWVRQLTGTGRDPLETWDNRATVLIEDNDPVYLPDGDLAFISTRSQTYGRCHGGRYNPAWVLYRADGNGDHIRQLSYGNENEYEPAVLNDGRIVFTRWEYTSRHEMLFHMLWWCRPDGTMVSNFYGNDTLHPMMVTEATAIPGTHKVVATAMGHHSYSTGTVVVIDTNKGENGEEPLTHITPETPYSETHGWPNPHYSHPHAITEDLFLVSRANHAVPQQGRTPPPNDRGIYLIDTLGGRELLYEDLSVASVSPIAVRPRERPPVLPSMLPADAPEYGTVFVQDVYLTRNDPENLIEPGTIRAIRVIALGVQPRANRPPLHLQVPVEIPRKVLGTVPVREDGSAHFRVPSNVALQLQTLDQHDRAILTEQSFFYLQPGEHRGCVGCHEPAGTTADMSVMARAALAPPVELTPAAGPAYEGGMSFMRTVQPVLDRYCISCHGLDATEKGVNLVHDGRLTWPQSYRALVQRGDHRLGEKEYMWGERNISRPFQFYARGNKISGMLVANHGDVDMDRDSHRRIMEWLDANAPCYGDLFPNKIEERRIDAEALSALRAHIREHFGDKLAQQPERALINTAQIDESRILMMPLAREGGGWGQIAGWRSRDEPGYQAMRELVERCIVRLPHENIHGWVPTLESGGGEHWVIEERERLRRLATETP